MKSSLNLLYTFSLSFLLFLPTFLFAQAPGEMKAEFFVDVTADTVFAGECFVVTGFLLIHRDNISPLGFSANMVEQVQAVHKILFKLGAYKFDSKIDSVYRENIKNGKYAAYRLFETALCPGSAGTIKVPEFELRLLKYLPDDKVEEVRLISKGAKVEVKSLLGGKPQVPTRIATAEEILVGDLKLKEEYQKENQPYFVGDTISATLAIEGKGNSFLAFPVKYQGEGLQLFIEKISYSDSISFDEFFSNKSMKIKFIPSAAGKYHLADYLNWKCFSPAEQKFYTLASDKILEVRESGEEMKESCSWPNAISVMDISYSMDISDYPPNRIAFCESFLNEWREESCTPAMVTFGGEANYFNGFFQAQKFDSLRRSGGSALGDALLLGVELLRTFPPLGRNLIVFSDGESNSGHLYYKEVAEIAKKNNIKIYAFAFGYEKEFSFPNKNGGVSHLSNVFDFDSLKEICETTGGKFHWVDKTDKLIELPIIQGLE